MITLTKDVSHWKQQLDQPVALPKGPFERVWPLVPVNSVYTFRPGRRNLMGRRGGIRGPGGGSSVDTLGSVGFRLQLP